MKKYFKLLITVIFILCTFIIFYVTVAVNVQRLPQFEVQTISGEKEAIEPLIIYGTFGSNIYNEDIFELKDKKTNYMKHRSLLEQVDPFFYEEKLIQLQKKYRHFMRDKMHHMNNFYEDDHFLAYCYIDYNFQGGSEYEFMIDILDKTTKKKTVTIKKAVPKQEDYSGVRVVDVQLHDDKLHVITENDMVNEESFAQVRHYTFDLNEKMLLNDEKVYDDGLTNEESYMVINPIQGENKHKQVALSVEQRDIVDEEHMTGHYREDISRKDVLIYDLDEKNLETYELIEDFADAGDPFYVDDEALYVGTLALDKLKIEKIDRKEKKRKQQLSTDLHLTLLDHHHIDQGIVKDGRFYFASKDRKNTSVKPSLVVIDLEKMKTVFTGSLKLQDGEINEKANLFIEYIDFK